MLSDQIALALAPFFDKIGPSHNEIAVLVRRERLERFEPPRDTDGDQIGKMKRVRAILTHARTQEPAAAERFAVPLVEALRSHGSFDRASSDWPGAPRFHQLQAAFGSVGYRLDDDGTLYPLTIDALSGAELTAALEAYVRRALTGAADDPLLLGNAKDLVEATARHAIEVVTGSSYPEGNFEATLWNAYDRLGLTPPGRDVIDATRKVDAETALAQSLFLVALASNRLRNRAGTGHGRPSVVSTASFVPRLASQAAGVVARLLLDATSRLGGRAA